MTSEENRYKETIEVYRKLGKRYLQGIEKSFVKELPDFIKLLPKNGRILDIGCSGGRDCKKFVQAGFSVIGIDLVEDFLKEARKNVPKAKFIKMDLRELKFQENYFDAIWASAVLLHIDKKDIPKVLKGFYRVLKTNGKLHIRVKKGKGVEFKKERLSDNKKRFFTYFSKKEMENYIKKANFKIIVSRIFTDELGRKDIKWISVWAEK